MSRPATLVLPAGVSPAWLTTARTRLAALVAEPRVRQRGTALLIPGFTGSKEDFLPVLEPLAAQGWRVVAIDQAGQHESPHLPSGAYDVPDLAGDVIALAGSLEPPVHLLGHSFGGIVARAAVIERPSAFASLTLLSSGPAAIPEPSAERLRLLLSALDRIDLATIYGVMLQLDLAAGIPPPDAELAAFLERRFLGNDPVAMARIARHLLAEPDRIPDLAAAAEEARLPVLVATGEGDDAWSPQTQMEMAERLGADAVLIPDAGHSPAVEQPSQTAAVLSSFWGAAAGE